MGEPRDPHEWQPGAGEPGGEPPPWPPPAVPYPQQPPQPGPWQAPPSGPWQASPGGYAGGPPGGYPGDYLAYPPVPPPRRSRTGFAVALVVAAVVVAAGGVALGIWLTRGSGGAARLVAPQTVGQYTMVTGSQADQVVTAIRRASSDMTGGRASAMIKAATIAVYSDQGSEPGLVFVGLTRAAARDAGVPEADDDTMARRLATMAPDTTPYPSGTHGGALRCGTSPIGPVTASVCAWADRSTLGMVISVNAVETRTPEQLSQTADRFRDAID